MTTPVGFLRHNFLPRSETFIYSSLRSLAEAGNFAVRVFALRRLMPERFPWTDVTQPRAPSRWLYQLLRIAPTFTRWARSVRLIHAHLGQTAPFAMAGAARAGVPFVVSYYGHDVVMYRTRERLRPFAWWYTLLRTQVFARAARILVLGSHMRRALESQGCPSDKLAIVRIGVDLARFDVARPPYLGPLRVLMVGREVDKKGFDDGLHACAALRERGVPCELAILGTGGPLHRPLRMLAERLALPATWLDPGSSAVDAMARADVLLAPSRRAVDGDEEGTPTVIVEASAARLPIVSTRHAGIPEQVDDGETGLLADERDRRGLAHALEVIARDPAKRRAMGEAGRRKMQRDYSLDAHRATLEAIYRDVLDEATR